MEVGLEVWKRRGKGGVRNNSRCLKWSFLDPVSGRDQYGRDGEVAASGCDVM
jgi:hypothetical protein